MQVFIMKRKYTGIKKESPNEGTETTPYSCIHDYFKLVIKKESPNEGTETRSLSLVKQYNRC